MATVEQSLPLLAEGDKLSREEFLRRWEAMPGLRKAELIRGIVHMPSPLSREHAIMDPRVTLWLGFYSAHTDGCEVGANGTWIMGDDDSPQPGAFLRVLPEFGGQSWNVGKYVGGAPELAGEVCLSSASYDLHQKLELYEKAGVREYVAVLLAESEIRWHRREASRFCLAICRSRRDFSFARFSRTLARRTCAPGGRHVARARETQRRLGERSSPSLRCAARVSQALIFSHGGLRTLACPDRRDAGPTVPHYICDGARVHRHCRMMDRP